MKAGGGVVVQHNAGICRIDICGVQQEDSLPSIVFLDCFWCASTVLLASGPPLQRRSFTTGGPSCLGNPCLDFIQSVGPLLASVDGQCVLLLHS